MELVKLVERPDQRHHAQHSAKEFPSAPPQGPVKQPGQEKSSNQEVCKMGRLVGTWKRRKVHVFARD